MSTLHFQILPFFITKESVYNFDYVFESYSSEEKNLHKTRILNLKENIESFKCQLYLTPEIINVYYSLYLKNNSFSEIPNIPHISYLKNDNVIEILNVSTMIKGCILEDFLKNNGLDYVCLVYEPGVTPSKLVRSDPWKSSPSDFLDVSSVVFSSFLLASNS